MFNNFKINSAIKSIFGIFILLILTFSFQQCVKPFQTGSLSSLAPSVLNTECTVDFKAGPPLIETEGPFKFEYLKMNLCLNGRLKIDLKNSDYKDEKFILSANGRLLLKGVVQGDLLSSFIEINLSEITVSGKNELEWNLDLVNESSSLRIYRSRQLQPQIQSLSMGAHFGCILKETGTVSCWGDNLNGEIGTGDRQLKFGLQNAIFDSNLQIKQITSGEHHTCALSNFGKIFCWGDNSLGQLGDGSFVTKYKPTIIPQGDFVVEKIQAAGNTTCALLTTGQVACWGQFGAIANGSGEVKHPSPIEIPLLQQKKFIDFKITDGSLILKNEEGVFLKYKNLQSSSYYPRKEDPNPAILAINQEQFSSVNGTGTFVCLKNEFNQIKCENQCPISNPFSGMVSCGSGQANFINSKNISSDFYSISDQAICFLNNETQIECINYRHSYVKKFTLPENFNLKEIQMMSATEDYEGLVLCVSSDQGEVLCSGNHSSYSPTLSILQTNLPFIHQVSFNEPQLMSLSEPIYSQITLGESHGCGLSGNDIFCWGRHKYFSDIISAEGSINHRQLSSWTQSKSDIRPHPKKIILDNFPLNSHITKIISGFYDLCALTADKKLFCGALSQHLIPVQLQGTDVINVAIGNDEMCALIDNGKVFCWNENSSGYMYFNSSVQSKILAQNAVAVNFPSSEIATEIYTNGLNSFCTKMLSSKIFCWEKNQPNSLRNLFDGSKAAPKNLLNVALDSFSMGDQHFCGTLANNEIACKTIDPLDRFQHLMNSQLPLKTQEKILKVNSGLAYSCVLTSLGRIFCWGDNTYGQIGAPFFQTYIGAFEVQLPQGVIAVDLVSQNASNCIKSATNKFYCWGYNTDGALGIPRDSFTQTLTPIEVH